MEITITGRHHSVDAPVREYLEEKLARLSRLSDRLTSVSAIVDQDHGRHVVELTVSAPPNHVFTAKVEEDDLRKAIDGADHKLEAQVRSWKDKLTDHRH